MRYIFFIFVTFFVSIHVWAYDTNYSNLVALISMNKIKKTDFPEKISIEICQFQEPVDGYSLLMVAAAENHEDAIKKLLQNGALVNQQMQWGTTALHLAFKYGHTGAAKILLDHGANLELVDKNAYCPIKLAIMTKKLSFFQHIHVDVNDYLCKYENELKKFALENNRDIDFLTNLKK